MIVTNTGGVEVSPTFDARGFPGDFEAVGGRVITNGQSVDVIYPAEAEVIPIALLDWGASIVEPHE